MTVYAIASCAYFISGSTSPAIAYAQGAAAPDAVKAEGGLESDLKQLEAETKRSPGVEKLLRRMAPERFPIWLKEAEKERAGAMWLVGLCHEFGIQIEPDLPKAANYHAQAAELGFAPAQYSLGWLYVKGLGVEKQSGAKARALFAAAATSGSYLGHYGLGNLYRVGDDEVPRDPDKAFAHTEKAADLGYALAQHHLALMYQHGDCVPKDEVKAGDLYALAAAQGLPESQVNLGIMYEFGTGGRKKSDHKAVELYKLASDQGEPGGQFSLALMYLQGRGGLPVNAEESFRLCRLAAAAGYVPAIRMLQNAGFSL